MNNSDWMCDSPYYSGPQHRGHRRCVRARRRIEAELRQANVAPEKTKRHRQGLDTSGASGRARGSLVPDVPSPASVQRDRAARQRIREKKRSQRPSVDMSSNE